MIKYRDIKEREQVYDDCRDLFAFLVNDGYQNSVNKPKTSEELLSKLWDICIAFEKGIIKPN